MTNIITLLDIEYKLLFRRKLSSFMAFIFPLAFYLLFTSLIDMPADAKKVFYKEYMYSMTVFSLMGFCLMQFPLEIIEERNSGWYKRLISTPITVLNYYLAKIIKTMTLFLASILLLFSVAHFYKGVDLSASEWILSGVSLWLGASMFLTLGLIITQFSETQKASSVANLLNIVLAIIGGLWFPVSTFPDWMQTIAKLTPTYHLRHLALEFGKGNGFNVQSFIILGIYSIIFLIIALLINKRKEVE
ncbi:ABC transporter permease [Staphylococcus haemolyticus]|uniref:ABC transporter permease n=1 Tax=Staphylococcus TaxID=1279 RepID=UPI00069CE7B6|nr:MULTISPECIES: ABC transporter permease [Staphylococcus]SIJ46989.1 ABC-type multidrug transport system, permease component [Mycobacteroides abscessus subsp. abscessus]MBE7355337.1 ABC transporter permease [Staphylococcus haemolyticus]MCE4964925.1 ABC transporter permease [Staphylococcus haemolyticus]MCE4991605.1 ABC transporter permease [Staphylococcus haemolyticus]MCE5036726.1 ABC transporter permease [Staphylococcus haemolyticus]